MIPSVLLIRFSFYPYIVGVEKERNKIQPEIPDLGVFSLAETCLPDCFFFNSHYRGKETKPSSGL
jgi:hypothetical protein